MEDVTFARVLWSELASDEWSNLVLAAFHPDFLGLGEAYTGVETAAEKLAAMAAYDDSFLIWHARCGEQLVGLATAVREYDRLLLYDVFVSPDFRRRGIARRLLEMAMQTEGVTGIETEVNQANANSQALMRSLGFTVVRSSDWLRLSLASRD